MTISPDIEMRPKAHPTITPDQISHLVDQFYQAIAEEPRLAPIFIARNKSNWAPHLSKMKAFWRSILLKSGEYKGQPPAVHMAISELQSDDFILWLDLFEQTSANCFHPEAAPIVNEFARRIARSLWLSCFGTPFDQPPF
ncbi:MAG: group III truncated hemoglobin [Salaquimonas sp.]